MKAFQVKLFQYLEDLWDNIYYYCRWWPQRVYKDARCWLKVCVNKFHLKLTYYALFHSYPWSTSYFYEMQYLWIKESLNYFENRCCWISDDHKREIYRWQKIALSLLEIATNKRELYNFTGKYPNLKQNMLVYVNLKNRHRYATRANIYDSSKVPWTSDYYLKSPDELYVEKARQLYLKLLSRYSEIWWD